MGKGFLPGNKKYSQNALLIALSQKRAAIYEMIIIWKNHNLTGDYRFSQIRYLLNSDRVVTFPGKIAGQTCLYVIPADKQVGAASRAILEKKIQANL